MNYDSSKVKSYLTYYKISESIRLYNNNRLVDAIYGSDFPVIAIGEDIVRDFQFAILMCGASSIHPCSYISFSNEDAMREWYKEDNGESNLGMYDIEVHGGITFYGERKQVNQFIFGKPDRNWLGWDYSHMGDYVPNLLLYPNLAAGHLWTTDELLAEVFNIYEQLIERGVI